MSDMTAFQAEAPGGGPAGPIRVSVLIPMYNSAPTIERAVRSALAQTLHDIEVLVADDASTDGGGDVVARLANADPRVRLICLGQNGGKPRAMNILVAQARGEWIAVLDADDAYHKLRLELLLDGAVRAGTDMAADNLNYIDSGITDPGSADGGFIRFGFDPADGDRVLGKADMVRNASSFATFDYGILKPVIRRDFVMAHRLRYDESSRLAEDFAYLLAYMVAGGRTYLCARPLYDWTMPFGPVSRRWTTTGAGAWRYDYAPAIAANRRLMAEMARRGEHDVVAMLQRRGRQYHAMLHYIAAQRAAAARDWAGALSGIFRHPTTWGLLCRRIAGRLTRGLHRHATVTSLAR